MAQLSDEDRKRVWRGLMRFWSRDRELMALDKPELRAAVDATDTWIEDNQASFNAALPLPARTDLTATQKTFIFVAVAATRMSVAFARRLFGNVD